MIRVECFGIELVEYGLLKKRPTISIQSSSYQDTFVDNQIQIECIDAGGIFGDAVNSILPNGTGKGEEVKIYEGDTLLFSGIVTSEKFTGSDYTFTIQSTIADNLRRILNIELVNVNPVYAVEYILLVSGLYSFMDLTSFDVEKKYYNDNGIVVSVLTIGQNATFESIINQLLDLMTAELYWYGGKLKIYSHAVKTTNPAIKITSDDMVAYPSIDSDGIDSILNDYSVSFIADGDFPAADADYINIGYQSRVKYGTKSWSFDAGTSSIIQILDRRTAHFFGARKMLRFAERSPTVLATVLNSRFGDMGLMDDAILQFSDFGIDGAFELVKIEQNGLVSNYSLQAINTEYREELFLDGTWLLDGTYTLNGLKD